MFIKGDFSSLDGKNNDEFVSEETTLSKHWTKVQINMLNLSKGGTYL